MALCKKTEEWKVLSSFPMLCTNVRKKRVWSQFEEPPTSHLFKSKCAKTFAFRVKFYSKGVCPPTCFSRAMVRIKPFTSRQDFKFDGEMARTFWTFCQKNALSWLQTSNQKKKKKNWREEKLWANALKRPEHYRTFDTKEKINHPEKHLEATLKELKEL